MNSTLTNFVMTIVTDWYSTVARWSPPGATSPAGCASCESSPFLRLPGLVEWPHDVIHPLVSALDDAVDQVGRSLDEVGTDVIGMQASDAQRREVHAQHALHLVYATALNNSEDMLDVLQSCVGSAIDEYVSRELASAIHSLDHADKPRK